MKVTIKIKGNKITCRTNADTSQVLKAIGFVQIKPSTRIKPYRRTVACKGLKNLGGRISYIFKAIKTACSKSFTTEDVPRHQYSEG